MITEVDTTQGGAFEVKTASGAIYSMDLTFGNLFRNKDGWPGDGSGYPLNDLRKDGEWVKIVGVKDNVIRVGERMIMECQDIADDPETVTWRMTTPVIEILEVSV